MTSIQLLLLALGTSAGLTMQARLKVRNVIIIYAYPITVYKVHLVVILIWWFGNLGFDH